MKIYQAYFFQGTKEIQEFWLQFIREMDKEMEKALKSAVKNSLVDLQKRIKGELTEIVPIFRMYTIISNGTTADAEWNVINEPSHLQLKNSIFEFIKQIIDATSVVKRLETIFRSQHTLIVEKMYKKDLENALVGGAMSRHNDNTNMTEEEKFNLYKAAHVLPEMKERKSYEYVDQVNKSKDINQLADNITKIVDDIKL